MLKFDKILLYHIICYFILKSFSFCDARNYCSPNMCNNSKQHTLCKYQSHKHSPRCVNYEKIIKTEKEKQAVLDKINSRRNKIAAGEIRSLPAAENMLKMVWNEELQISAQRWADQCVEHSVPDIKDTCRDLENVYVGQNIATIYGDAPGLTPISLVDVWYMELLNINASVLPKYRESLEIGFSHYDYFTQLAWAESNQVGCGGVKFKDLNTKKNRTVYRLVCNFAPGGNRVGRAVYLDGLPCSQCPTETCDSTYNALCSSEFFIEETKSVEDTAITSSFSSTTYSHTIAKKDLEANESFMTSELQKTTTEIQNTIKETQLKNDDDFYTPFDYFAHSHKFTRQLLTVTTLKPDSCKHMLAVDDFVELLKNKLSSDAIFKELLLTTKLPGINGNADVTFTDASVAALMNRIYSKKEISTTTKIPNEDHVNSTLLVDLVEAVIFRSNDRNLATDEVIRNTESMSEVSPVKIQAELAEVKPNYDFRGHYFFPEDDNEETIEPKIQTTEDYYDISNLPSSDILLEIEDIKRKKATKDFLDEIIESDFMTESTTTLNLLSPDSLNIYKQGHSNMKKFLEEIGDKRLVKDIMFNINNLLNVQKNKHVNQLKRKKRKNKLVRNKCRQECTQHMYNNQHRKDLNNFDFTSFESHVTIEYKVLLKKIVADLEVLNLKERFHCTQNCSVAITFSMFNIYIILFITCYEY